MRITIPLSYTEQRLKPYIFISTLYSPRLFDFDNLFVTYFIHSEFSHDEKEKSL